MPADLQSLYFAGWACLFVVGAFLAQRATGRPEAFYIYAGIGVAYLAAATAAELEGAALTIAFAFEVAALVIATLLATGDIRVTQKTTMLMAIPTLLSIPSALSSAWGAGAVVNEDFFVLLVLAAVYFLLGLACSEAAARSGDADAIQSNTALYVAGSVYIFVLLWRVSHAMFLPDTAVLVSLVVYTLVGIAAYIAGATRERAGLRTYGGVLLGVVVARLLVIDVWNMELTWRIITFFAIGVLLMSTAFLGKRPAIAPQA